MLKKLNKNLRKNKKSWIGLSTFFGIFVLFNFAHAGPIDAIVLGTIGLLVQVVVGLLGALISVSIQALTVVASYSNFINEPNIVRAWVIIRDFCNMFFILVLLIIAFATILRVQNYNMKKLLPKLLIMAVLINFSRTIAGIIIDFSQVFLLTFMSAIGDTGGNIVNTLGVQKYLDIVKGKEWLGEMNLASTLIGMAAGVIFMLIALSAIVAMLSVFTMRIIMLWIYVVLSPLAFLLASFPAGQAYAGKWWSEFSKTVIVGPVLAFFFWLAIIASTSTPSPDTAAVCFGPSKMFCPAEFSNFFLSIGFLMGGLMIASQISSVAGSAAGKAFSSIKSGQAMPLKLAKGATKAPLTFGVNKLHQKTGVDLNAKRVWSGIQTRRTQKNAERYAQGQTVAAEAMRSGGTAHGILAMTGSPAEGWNQLTSIKGLKQRLRGGKNAKTERDKRLPELSKAKFEKDFVNMDEETRIKQGAKLEDMLADKKVQVTKESDSGKRKELEAEQKVLEDKVDFSQKHLLQEDALAARKSTTENYKAKYDDFRQYMPIVNNEARLAEQKLVSDKKSELSNITDADEMLGMLDDALDKRDNAMVKALVLKMTAQGDDNEIMKHYGFEESTKGTQDFVDMLHKEKGFGSQEAHTLGGDLSQLAKGTDHWNVAGSFRMENGEWRKSTEDEQTAFHSSESQKKSMKGMIGNGGRTAYGYHDTSGAYHVNDGGVALLNSYNTKKGLEELESNANKSAMHWLRTDIKGLIKAVKAGNLSESVFARIAKGIEAKDRDAETVVIMKRAKEKEKEASGT